MIKVISFDIGGTLLKSNSSNDYSLSALTKLLNLPYDEVRHAYKEVFQKSDGTKEELITKFTNLLNFISNKYALVDEEISDEYINLFKKLKEAGYKVILFSNSCSLVKSTIKNKLKNIVDGIFYSYELGYTKSDHESYTYIEHKLGYQPNEFLHIGDTLNSDYYKPLANGWNALYYGTTDDENVNTITNLSNILDLLKDNNYFRGKNEKRGNIRTWEKKVGRSN